MNEAFYQRVVDAALDAIITIDGTGRVTGFNQAAERLFGHTAHAAIGRDLAELIIPPRYRDAHRAGMRRFRETGVAVILDKRLELAAMRADGVEFPCELTVVKVSGADPPTFAGYVRDISERVQAEREYRELIDFAPVGIYRTNAKGRILSANPALARMLGVKDPEQLVGRMITDFYVDPEERERLLSRFGTHGAVADLDVQWKKVDGKPLRVQLNIRVLLDDEDRVSYLAFVRDVSERYDLEQALQQAQKMDAVGRLAGGVAHDFNNILTAIMGYAEMLKGGLAEGDVRRADAEEIRRSALRAAELTQQLLAFGRKQILAPRVLDLGTVVRDLEPLLRRIIGPDVTVRTSIAPDLGRVEADPGRIEQVMLNLAANARDAMPDGGTLSIALENGVLSPSAGPAETAPAGAMVVLSVSDTGVGMDEKTQRHIFEPFFTTKEAGAGTGLGLATVYGIVHQSGGHVEVSSKPGAGSTFRLYLPRVDGAVEVVAVAGPKTGKARPGETVLVVEDEPAVRALLQRALGRAGFKVLAASDSRTAREQSAAHQGRIHLLLTDVVMPGGGGRALADELVAARPDLKVIYMSGYTDDVIARQRVRDPGVVFLQKPFSTDEVAARIRDVLDGKPGPG